jgi:hypothetical protein
MNVKQKTASSNASTFDTFTHTGYNFSCALGNSLVVGQRTLDP